MEQTVLQMMGALEGNGSGQIGDMENPPVDGNAMIGPETVVGRNAVDKMAELEEIGGLQS
jgi:hypothetical protein